MIQHQFERALLFSLGTLVWCCGCAAHKDAPAAPPAAGVASLPAPLASPSPEAVNQYITKMRNDLYRDKNSIINGVMQLSPDEATVFWPLYQKYKVELFGLGDVRVGVTEQFNTYSRNGKLNDTEASRLATAYFDYVAKRAALLKKYHGVIAEKLSPVRAVQFTQVEDCVTTLEDLLRDVELPLISAPAPSLSRTE